MKPFFYLLACLIFFAFGCKKDPLETWKSILTSVDCWQIHEPCRLRLVDGG